MRLLAILAVTCALGARPARAQDEFEIQVYDAKTAERGEPGLELHANAHAIDHAPDELHLTLEPHYGALDWLELGGYLQSAAATTGDVAYAGVKLRVKARWPRRLWCERIGLALNAEVSRVPARFEPNGSSGQSWGSELRPVVELVTRDVYASVNPIVSTDFSGALAGQPQFEPAAKLAWRATAALSLGGEGYAALGPFDDLGLNHKEAAYAAIDYAGSWWDLNAALGWSWGSTDHAVAKVIFGIHPSAKP